MSDITFNFHSQNSLYVNLDKEYDYLPLEDEENDTDDEPELTEEELQKQREEKEKETDFYYKMAEKLKELQGCKTEDDPYDMNYVYNLIQNHEITPIEYDKDIFTQEFLETHFKLINYNFNSDFLEHTFTFNNLNFYIKENIDDNMFYNSLSISLLLINNLDKFDINDNGAYNNEELIQQIIYNFMLIDSYVDVVKIKSNDKTLNIKIKQYDYKYIGPGMFALHQIYYDYDISFLSFLENKKIVKPIHIREYIQNKSYNLIFDLIVSKIGCYNKIMFFDIKDYLMHNIYDNSINYECFVNSKFSYHKFIENKILNS